MQKANQKKFRVLSLYPWYQCGVASHWQQNLPYLGGQDKATTCMNVSTCACFIEFGSFPHIEVVYL